LSNKNNQYSKKLQKRKELKKIKGIVKNNKKTEGKYWKAKNMSHAQQVPI